jgi:predicted DNA-binding protein (UPF0251 family)
MVRPLKNRAISSPPKMVGFKPYGIQVNRYKSVSLKFEEFESIRLVVYNQCSQEDAAIQMNVSRPTLTRIYNNALKVIAKALVEGREIEIEGGNYRFDAEWFRCKKCYKLIQGIDNHIQCEDCTSYSDAELENLNRS